MKPNTDKFHLFNTDYTHAQKSIKIVKTMVLENTDV